MKNIFYTIFAISLSLALGKLAHFTFGSLPASLYGMIIYCSLLQLKWLNFSRVQTINLWFIKNMGVFFVPAGVGIINHFDLIKRHGLALIVIIFVSTFILLTLVALLSQRYLVSDENLS